MARIEEINQGESGAIKKYKNGEAKVVMKEYILNDLKAFEKKWKMRNITPIKVSEEASNGSSIHVDLKTSLFEAVKNSFVTVVQSDPNMSKVEHRRIVKAKTNNAGDTDVEYIFDVALTKDGNEHGIIGANVVRAHARFPCEGRRSGH